MNHRCSKQEKQEHGHNRSEARPREFRKQKEKGTTFVVPKQRNSTCGKKLLSLFLLLRHFGIFLNGRQEGMAALGRLCLA